MARSGPVKNTKENDLKAHPCFHLISVYLEYEIHPSSGGERLIDACAMAIAIH
jgi:hypothetical protein